MNITLKELVAGVDQLLSPPEVYFRLEELLHDDHSSAGDLGEVISYDPALASRLLKIVNSAFYRFPAKIDNLSRAISIIGTQDLQNLVLATMAVEEFNKISSDLVDMSTFWHHSVYCALAARMLARRCCVLHPERIFAAGLLHDVGQLIIYHEIPELARRALSMAEASDDGLYYAEQQVFGFHHGQVGAALFNAWGLPPVLQEVAEFHHEPGKAPNFSLETAIVHLANSAVNAVEPGRNIPECKPLRDSEAWRRTGLSEEDLRFVLEEANLQFFEVLEIISPGALLIY